MPNDSKADRQQEILMAALQAFAEKGYDKTTIEDIVRLSGLSKGTLYWYFTNKEAIFAALVQMVFEGMWLPFEEMRQQTIGQPPPDRLRQLLLNMSASVDDTSSWIGLYVDFFNQAWQKPAVRDQFSAFYGRLTGAIEPIVQQGIDEGIFRPVDPSVATRMLIGALDGYWFQQILDIGAAQPVMLLYAETIIRGLMNNDAKNS